MTYEARDGSVVSAGLLDRIEVARSCMRRMILPKISKRHIELDRLSWSCQIVPPAKILVGVVVLFGDALSYSSNDKREAWKC